MTISLLVSGFAYAQPQNGFYGKKNYFELNSISYFKLVGNYNSPASYKRSGSGLTPEKKWFETGVQFCLGHAFRNNFGLAVEFNYEPWKMPPFFGNSYYDRHEMLSMKTMTFMPKVEFSLHDALFPSELAHQVGVGFSTTRVIEMNYIGIPYDLVEPPSKLLNYNRRYKGMSFMYSVEMRTPVSQSLMISYGFRYLLNIGLQNHLSGPTNTQDQYAIPSEVTAEMLNRYRIRNFMQLKLGVVVPF